MSEWKMDTVKHTHFDKDGKLQQGLNPEVDINPAQYPCPSCERLKVLCGELWKRGSTVIYLNDADKHHELKQRLKQEGVVK